MNQTAYHTYDPRKMLAFTEKRWDKTGLAIGQFDRLVQETSVRTTVKSISMIVVIVTVKVVTLFPMIIVGAGHQIEFEWVEADDLESRTAFVASDPITLFALGVDINFFAAVGTNRCWHFYDLRKKVKILVYRNNLT